MTEEKPFNPEDYIVRVVQHNRGTYLRVRNRRIQNESLPWYTRLFWWIIGVR